MVYYRSMIEHHLALKLVVEQWEVRGRILGFDLWILKEIRLLNLEDSSREQRICLIVQPQG